MPEKILYYLGAGASVNALPLAKTVYKPGTNKVQILGLAYELRTFDFKELIAFSHANADSHTALLTSIAENFKKLADKADEFGDVDTYAKYLKINQSSGNEFKDLKQTLSWFFCLQQVLNHTLDKRYLPWLVSVMNFKKFPENIKVLSWNYDFQLELAFSNFSPPEEIEFRGTSFLHSPSMLTHYPNLDLTFSDFHFLSLIHLNGIAGYAKMEDRHPESIFQAKFRGNKQSALTFLEQNNLADHLHFAWEGGTYHKDLMQHVETMIGNTSILVVVGYSFPFFNREVDKQVFEKLKLNSDFKKVYYQDPILNGQQLKAQFDLPDRVIITHIPYTDNFYIPFEY